MSKNLIEYDHREDLYLYSEIVKPRGRGFKFQWNAIPHYVITKANGTIIGKFTNKKDARNAFLLELMKA